MVEYSIMELPILNLLKLKTQKDMASLQDETIELLYTVLPNAVLHGGTAIWRCYNGKRFSIDLDLYSKIEDLKEKLAPLLSSRQLFFKKYKETKNVAYSIISDGSTEVKLDINKR